MEGKGACNPTATENEKRYSAGTSPDKALSKGQDTANSRITEIKDEPGTNNSPSTAFMKEQVACNSSATGIRKGQCAGISQGAHLKERGPGSKRGRKRKISVNTSPPTNRCSDSVTRLLSDNDAVTEETTPSGEVAVKRSRRTRKPTFSSSEWETPLDSPCRHSRSNEIEKKNTKIRTKSSPSVRLSRPKKKQREDDGSKDSVQQDECGDATAGNVILPSELHEDEARSDSTSVVATADRREADIEQNAAISEDMTCGGDIGGEMITGTQTGGSTETKQVDDGEEMMTPDDSPAKSQIEDNHPVTDAGKCYLILIRRNDHSGVCFTTYIEWE